MSYNTPKALTVLQVSAIDGTVQASTALATTASGSVFVPLYVSIQCTSTTGFAVAASLSIGTNSASFNNILPITALTGISGATLMLNFPLVAAISTVAASTGISVKITTGATATTYVLTVSLIGFYS